MKDDRVRRFDLISPLSTDAQAQTVPHSASALMADLFPLRLCI